MKAMRIKDGMVEVLDYKVGSHGLAKLFEEDGSHKVRLDNGVVVGYTSDRTFVLDERGDVDILRFGGDCIITTEEAERQADENYIIRQSLESLYRLLVEFGVLDPDTYELPRWAPWLPSNLADALRDALRKSNPEKAREMYERWEREYRERTAPKGEED